MTLRDFLFVAALALLCGFLFGMAAGMHIGEKHKIESYEKRISALHERLIDLQWERDRPKLTTY